MSVSESEKECPLCMEALDWDDLGFFPCSCGYQICRFCWHRLRTDENGLCPACRQAFPDIPVSFNPEISAEELKKQKKRNKERRSNKDQFFKPQDLATLRVVQKNLVFVIGLSSRLTQEDLKKEFAHFGKIIKFVHNKSTAYITYSKPEEAIRAIRTLNASAAHESAVQQLQLQSQLINGNSVISSTATTTTPAPVTTTTTATALSTQPTNLIMTTNNIINNGNNNPVVASLITNNNYITTATNAMSVLVPPNRLKASLGTTKYCNHFLRSQQCPKVGECMYLHEIAEAEASFTKEQMQAGKHVEYEKKLMDSYVAKLEWQANLVTQNNNSNSISNRKGAYEYLPSNSRQQQPQSTQQPQQQLQSQVPTPLSHQQPVASPQPRPQTQSQLQLQLQLQQQLRLQQLQSQQPSPPPLLSPQLQAPPLQQQQQRQQQQQQLQQQLQQEQQQSLVDDTDSEDDDGLDFDPISVSTSGLRDLLDQQVQQAKQLQMQNYIQQMSSDRQTISNVLFQHQNRLNHSTQTNGLLGEALVAAAAAAAAAAASTPSANTTFNGHTQFLPTLASLTNSNTTPPAATNQQQQTQSPAAIWQNLSAWSNYLQRSGYGFENGR